MAPVPEMIAQRRAYEEALKAELLEEGVTPQPKEVPPRSWVGPEDQPGGPKDIVKVLNIRPCYLLGRTAASYLYSLGQYLLAHPEMVEEEAAGHREAE